MVRIILDTDLAMGAGSDIDDGFALALAHAERDIQIDLITTVNGNTDVESATALTLELTRRLAIDAPVVKGASTPFTHPDRVRVPDPATIATYGAGMAPTPGYAAAAIADLVMANPGEITIVAIGPLTNVAAAIALEPRLAGAVKEIVMMGGVFLQTRTGPVAGEFNVWIDPEAAAAVLRSGAPQRWVGLDVTTKVRLTRDHARRMLEAPGEFAPFAGETTLTWIDYLHTRDPGDPLNEDSCAMHDPLAVAAIVRPEFLTWAPAHVEVVTGDGTGRGVMVTDLLTAREPTTPNCQIAVAVDADAFMSYFLDSLTTL